MAAEVRFGQDMSKGVPKGRTRADWLEFSESHLAAFCRTLLSAEKMEHIAGPAGIAVDATDLYWANLKALQSQPGQCSRMVLSGDVSRFGA